MADTIREQIIEAFALKVGAGRCLKLDGDSDLPARSLWDNQEEAEKTAYGSMKCSIDLPIEYLAKVDSAFSNHSKQANAMLAELIQSATSGDNSLGGLCRSIEYKTSEFIYPEDGSQEIEVFCVFTLVYEFAIGNPFSLA